MPFLLFLCSSVFGERDWITWFKNSLNFFQAQQQCLWQYVYLLFFSAWTRKIATYYIDKSVLVENRPLVKFIRSYIRDSSGVFSISSLVRISKTSFPALTLLFVQKYSCLYNKKENYTVAWRYGKKHYFTHSLRSFVKYCFYHSKIKFISSRHIFV